MTAKQTKDEFRAKLIADGMDPTFAESMADMAENGGQLAKPGDHSIDRLSGDRRDEAEREAVDIAMALAESRMPTTALRRLISPLRRSRGLVLWILARCCAGKPI